MQTGNKKGGCHTVWLLTSHSPQDWAISFKNLFLGPAWHLTLLSYHLQKLVCLNRTEVFGAREKGQECKLDICLIWASASKTCLNRQLLKFLKLDTLISASASQTFLCLNKHLMNALVSSQCIYNVYYTYIHSSRSSNFNYFTFFAFNKETETTKLARPNTANFLSNLFPKCVLLDLHSFSVISWTKKLICFWKYGTAGKWQCHGKRVSQQSVRLVLSSVRVFCEAAFLSSVNVFCEGWSYLLWSFSVRLVLSCSKVFCEVAFYPLWSFSVRLILSSWKLFCEVAFYLLSRNLSFVLEEKKLPMLAHCSSIPICNWCLITFLAQFVFDFPWIFSFSWNNAIVAKWQVECMVGRISILFLFNMFTFGKSFAFILLFSLILILCLDFPWIFSFSETIQ